MKTIKALTEHRIKLQDFGYVHFSETEEGKWMIEFLPYSGDYMNMMLIKLPEKDGGQYIKALEGLLEIGQKDYPNQATDL